MLTEKEISTIKEALLNAQNPLFFYDDDPDGLCSFLLLYKLVKNGKGVILKSTPKLDKNFLHKVQENNPDVIFVLDIPIIDQDFIDAVKCPIYWIDHHEPLNLRGVNYYNPRIKEASCYLPTSSMAYQINNREEDLWIATIGCLYDWHMPYFIDRFIEKYPQLLPVKKDLEDAVFHQPVGKLGRIFSFLLKGTISEVREAVKNLSRIETPEEILDQKSSRGKWIYKNYEKINHKYVELIEEAKKRVTRSKIVLFFYAENKWSFTADLANELTTLYPQKVIIIARKKSGEVKSSIRAKINIRDPIAKALVGINGYGGGHENACGAVIKEEDWDRFLENLKREIS